MSLSATFGVEGGASRPSEVPFQLLAFPFNPFPVRSFRGREELSGIYAFDIVVTGPDIGERTVERLSLGQRALLVLRAGKAPRVFRGIVASVRHEGSRGAHGASTFRMRLVSRLWLLKHRRRSRIYQNQRIDQILRQVLGEANIDARFLLLGEHPIRGLLGPAASARAAKVFAGETVVRRDDVPAPPEAEGRARGIDRDGGRTRERGDPHGSAGAARSAFPLGPRGTGERGQLVLGADDASVGRAWILPSIARRCSAEPSWPFSIRVVCRRRESSTRIRERRSSRRMGLEAPGRHG